MKSSGKKGDKDVNHKRSLGPLDKVQAMVRRTHVTGRIFDLCLCISFFALVDGGLGTDGEGNLRNSCRDGGFGLLPDPFRLDEKEGISHLVDVDLLDFYCPFTLAPLWFERFSFDSS